MSSQHASEVVIRQATPADAAVCGPICYKAFSTINAEHNFPCDFPSEEVATGVMGMIFSSPDFYCVVAERDGQIIGSNCIDYRSVIAGIGPITVDPGTQNAGVGRMLMEAVMEHARERGAAGIRLVQAAFHNRSLSLYARLGFAVREPLACFQGRARERSVAGCTVRPAADSDVDVCIAISLAVHGFDRTTELRQGIGHKTALVVERGGRITGYASSLAFFGHATAETNPDLLALIASAESFGGSGILVPSRNTAVFQWCLANGLRVVQPMTLMSVGLYNEPAGAWLSSVTF